MEFHESVPHVMRQPVSCPGKMNKLGSLFLSKFAEDFPELGHNRVTRLNVDVFGVCFENVKVHFRGTTD